MGKVALTFDDLPGLSLFNDQAWLDFINRELLRGLKRHHIPAIGFVNESKLDEAVRAPDHQSETVAERRNGSGQPYVQP
jgi:peptidoglycan/xylan/chitin deacetylase (PgdA/CDA1 family)